VLLPTDWANFVKWLVVKQTSNFAVFSFVCVCWYNWYSLLIQLILSADTTGSVCWYKWYCLLIQLVLSAYTTGTVCWYKWYCLLIQLTLSADTTGTVCWYKWYCLLIQLVLSTDTTYSLLIPVVLSADITYNGWEEWLIRIFKITFWNVGIHMLSHVGGSVALGSYKKGQWGSKEKDGYRTDSEIESCVK